MADLAAMRHKGMVPKLGALCRWVRDVDAVSFAKDSRLCQVMHAVLRTASSPASHQTDEDQTDQPEGGIIYHDPWDGGSNWRAATSANVESESTSGHGECHDNLKSP
eukprot:scaffold274583_cov32-Prasinocladus_malaysianus.AAC.1